MKKGKHPKGVNSMPMGTRIVTYICLAWALIVSLVPLGWLVLSSLKKIRWQDLASSFRNLSAWMAIFPHLKTCMCSGTLETACLLPVYPL